MDKTKKIHFIGIKGVGMSALAVLAKEKGFVVSGADVNEDFVTNEALLKAGIEVKPFNPENLSDVPDFVVVSAAFGKDNVEVKQAQKKRLNLLTYSEALSMLIGSTKTIAVAGIHGKTTTTALISFILKKAGLDPSFLIGAGQVRSLGANAHFGSGEYFVVEADEYRKSQESKQSKFLDLSPEIEIITSIEMDHPDLFPSLEEVYAAFYKFACRVARNGFIVICTDYPRARKLVRSIADRRFETFGFELHSDWRIVDYIENENETKFSLQNSKGPTQKIGPFTIKIPGRANVLNAAAAVITAKNLNLKEGEIKEALAEFSEVKRRFEIIAKKNGVVLIDDYAHHPRSISLTLEAARRKFPNYKIWCIFQPHTYSRTKGLLDGFAKAFSNADKVYITEIYASEREKEVTISPQELTNEISKHHPAAKFVSDWDELTAEITKKIKKPAIILTCGAGDIYKIQDKLKSQI